MRDFDSASIGKVLEVPSVANHYFEVSGWQRYTMRYSGVLPTMEYTSTEVERTVQFTLDFSTIFDVMFWIEQLTRVIQVGL